MFSTDNHKIYKRDFSSTEHGLKYLHLLNFSPRALRVSGVHRNKQENTLLLLHTTCLRTCQSICSPHRGCSGNLQLLRAQIWLTKFREHSEGRAFFSCKGFPSSEISNKECWTHSSCCCCDHTLPKPCLNTALPSSPYKTPLHVSSTHIRHHLMALNWPNTSCK